MGKKIQENCFYSFCAFLLNKKVVKFLTNLYDLATLHYIRISVNYVTVLGFFFLPFYKFNCFYLGSFKCQHI